MMRTSAILLGAAWLTGAAAFGAETTSASKLYDGQIKTVEGEVVSLAEAMPAEKYNFAPTNGEFKGVRTFGEQVKHLAAVIYIVSAGAQQKSLPARAGTGESGPESVKTKEQIVQYLKDAFAYAHEMTATITDRNQLDLVKSPFGGPDTARGGLANVVVWHTFDHYGQMAVYARMNGIVPPASRQ